ncbi:hypothetical protein MVUOKPPV_CDS0012 [Klebsiella phage phi1_175008]|uniref:Uncharacterized protein n=2 Tax=Klebsiella phage phi1_175008 TaxID=3127744 RepID=A0AC61ZTP8_9CAUD
MRVKLLNDGGYEGLVNVQFPVEVEVEREGYGNVYVGWDAISAIPGWFYHKNDAYEGGSYYFYRYEVEIVGAEVEERITALRETGVSVSDTFVQNVADSARKDKLISLVRDYGGAISDGCYESECGSLQAMFACHEEEKRLLKEIIKMIEEGV